jgi:hypothetical protein
MFFQRRNSWRAWLVVLLTSSLVMLATPLAAAPVTQTSSSAVQAAFTAAANEFHVPENVLLSVGYNMSRWEQHDGQPSTTGGYGVMHLVDLGNVPQQDARGEGDAVSSRSTSAAAGDQTLVEAAQLLGLSPDVLKQDAAQNIRGGAALLAKYARETVGATPGQEADWYGAVAKYSGSEESAVALGFADDVYATIQSGIERTTTDGQTIILEAKKVKANKGTADSLYLRNTKKTGADCPNGLACQVIPAAYTLNDLNDLSDYGNYDVANREADGLDIQYIVIHDTETPYYPTIRLFQNPAAYVSAHYVLRAGDGQITQMVNNKDVAWTAGNWYINIHSINLEHEGYALEGASWYSEQLYRSSARLVRYLADKYGIPLDRAHIVGHDDVPGPTPYNQTRMHWDPGPFWDWAHYMRLLGAPINPSGGDRDSNIVTINPNFATNTLPFSDAPTQSSSFVYLHTAPDANAPLLDDPALSGPGTLRASDWGDKAATGQQFYRVDRQGDWDAIYFGGQKAWFRNPRHSTNTVPGSGTLVTPKAGKASIPVYGRAYPEASAYPVGVPVQSIVPLQYNIPAGQVYVAKDLVKGDYYRAPTYTFDPSDHTVVEGQEQYYLIFFNHRFAFVKASDVDVVTAP